MVKNMNIDAEKIEIKDSNVSMKGVDEIGDQHEARAQNSNTSPIAELRY